MTLKTGRVAAVLFLEDDASTVEVLRDLILMHFGDRVVGLAASTVEGAKELYWKYQGFIRVIMADQFLRTDRVQGAEFVHWLKEEHNFQGALVAFSGNYDSVGKLVAAGCNHELQKPIHPEEFLRILEKYS